MTSINAKVIPTIIAASLVLAGFAPVLPVSAAIELVKSDTFGTVYYLDGAGVRHPFPNEATYRSWYGSDFAKIVTVSNDFLARYPLGKNITVRPGTFLVKIRTAPAVYAVEQGGVLRRIDDEDIAAAIYGANWAGRVVDIPDVFFGDYIIGDPIIHDYKVPNDVLFRDQKSGRYSYKRNDILQPFASAAAMSANHFDVSQAIVSSRSFFVRSRPIEGFDRNVFNPVAAPLVDRRDCENQKLKAAVIMVVADGYTTPEVENVERVRAAVTDRFSWATDGLANIDVSYPVTVMTDDGYLTTRRNDGTIEVNNEVVNTFYDTNADDFDFLIVWTNFKVPSENTNEMASFIGITNKLEGTNRASLDRSTAYGSNGKLKGVIMMGNINKYQPDTATGLNQALNYVLHEILHQWSAYIGFDDGTGRISTDLLREGLEHWSYYAGFISPLGGSGWIDNGDGTFRSGLAQLADPNVRQYSPLDLYLMGLIPRQLMGPVFYVEPKNEGAMGNTIEGTARWVTIDQIVKANGAVRCSLD